MVTLFFHRYADSPDPKNVIDYLESQKSKGRPGEIRQKYHTYLTLILIFEVNTNRRRRPLSDMRRMTTRALPPLLRWASEQRPGEQVGGVNILCCDFVAVSRFCSLVIGLNYKRRAGKNT